MTNQVTKFMLYMFNRWSMEEARQVFGDGMGEHLFNKWAASGCNELMFYAQLDAANRRKLVVRACDCYPNVND